MLLQRKLVSLLLPIQYFIILNCLINLHTCDNSCQFPAEWSGEWFQRGESEYVRIQNGTISTKGSCYLHEPNKNKYILFDPIKKCYRCVVIHQNHINLLQYKQSYCLRTLGSLSRLCSSITGDSQLLSIFRVNANPVPCPFTDHYTMVYNRGQRDCALPLSSVSPCTDPSKLHFKFQACVDVRGSESSNEQLQCLASWRNGPEKYVVGKMFRYSAKTDNEIYRCFIYTANEDGDGYGVAQSADASCDGVSLSPLMGARIMKLKKVHMNTSCTFPRWMSDINVWIPVNRKEKYVFTDRNMSLNVFEPSLPDVMTNIRCLQTLAIEEEYAKLIVHVTAGCDDGYRCMEIFKRNNNYIQIRQGKIARHQDLACSDFYFESESEDSITLNGLHIQEKSAFGFSISQAVTDLKFPNEKLPKEDFQKPSETSEKCPYNGEYVVEEDDESIEDSNCPTSFMNFGCHSENSIEISSECSSNTDRFKCHANWTHGRNSYVLASKLNDSKHYCFVYTEHEGELYYAGKFKECPSKSIPTGNESQNRFLMKRNGQCSKSNNAASFSSPINLLYFYSIVTFMLRLKHAS